MGTTADKLQYLIDAKNSISAAIEAKGGTVPTELSGYGPAIAALPSGTPDYTVVQYNSGSLSSYYDTTEIATLTNEHIAGIQTVQSMKTANNVRRIGSSFFQPSSGTNSVLKSFDGNQLTSIGGYAFYNCTGLSSINLGEHLIDMGNYTFQGCTGLGSIEFPNTLSGIGQQTFQGCSGLSATLVIPDSVKEIYASAFRYCSNLTDVVIGNGTTNIYGYAFSDSSKLSSVTFGNSLSSFSAGVFMNCTGLSSIAFPDSLTVFGGSSGSVVRNCSNLAMIDFGYTRTTVPTMAATNNFANIPANYSIYVPSSLMTTWKSAQNWSSVSSHIHYKTLAYYDAESATPIAIVGNIGASTIPNKTSLVELILGDEVTGFESSALQDCAALTYVDLGSTITTIGASAFRNCTSLGSMVVPNSVTTIGNYVFNTCSSMTGIEIGTGVTAIGAGVFAHCVNLETIDFGTTRSTIPTLDNANSFLDLNANYKIYVPSALLNNWKAAANWSDVASHIYAHP